jgi:uncharacterized protein YbbC (DUF1343 family)
MVKSGLEIILENFPSKLKGKRIGILCHAPSITSDFSHITEIFFRNRDCTLTAIFGPQHGLFGQTQDNMIEWSGYRHPLFNVPVYSLYGEHRKPTSEMIDQFDDLIIDLQDVGARLYTYIWSVKLCMEACAQAGKTVWLLDRPNPIAAIDFDGPVLKEEFFTFVGGASIPLCHRMTIGEIAVWIKEKYIKECDLKVVWMKNWHRSMMYNHTGLPWILPSPNMPNLNTAIVYPGTVLIEALNISEGRGTTLPFELFGAPFIDNDKLKKTLDSRHIPGCLFRIHNFIPAFNKYSNIPCKGIQIHITDLTSFKPVSTALEIFEAVIETTKPGEMKFNDPPYEYEYNLIPFDILSGDSGMRTTLKNRTSLKLEKERWLHEAEDFKKEFSQLSAYPDKFIY